MGAPVRPLDSTRTLHSPMDKLPLEYYPLETKMGARSEASPEPTAPADKIPERYSNYFHQVFNHDQSSKAPHGLSVVFFSMANTPANWRDGKFGPTSFAASEGVVTRVDPFLDYRSARSLSFPARQGGAPDPPNYWIKWSGTMEIALKGNYAFDLPVVADV